ncbi:YezD family protein [Amphibacillus sp. MSJ-3]|nr:YezD family protein [Amphibacillus sp. MSJ-3]MBU5595297.1 YezD family protein [Amphibacillus sp. MSJ-3]
MGNRSENIELSLEKIKEMLDSMSYGSVTLIIQDKHVVQIEKNEKIRLK